MSSRRDDSCMSVISNLQTFLNLCNRRQGGEVVSSPDSRHEKGLNTKSVLYCRCDFLASCVVICLTECDLSDLSTSRVVTRCHSLF